MQIEFWIETRGSEIYGALLERCDTNENRLIWGWVCNELLSFASNNSSYAAFISYSHNAQIIIYYYLTRACLAGQIHLRYM